MNSNHLACLSLLALPLPLPALAQTLPANIQAIAPQLIETYGDSVVGIEGVLSVTVRMSGQVAQQQEQEVSTSAIVVSPEGYLITALSNLDPSDRMNGRVVDMGGQKQTLEVEADLSELKVYLQDGSSFDAKAILRDPQSDLLLLQIDDAEAANHPWTSVPLDPATPAPQLLDPILLLGRNDAQLDRSLIAALSHIEAVVERPRPLFLPNSAAASQIAFNAQGAVIGLSAQRLGEGPEALQAGAVVVIQPVSEIQRLLTQAAEGITTEDDSDKEENDDAEADQAPEANAETPAEESSNEATEETPSTAEPAPSEEDNSENPHAEEAPAPTTSA